MLSLFLSFQGRAQAITKVPRSRTVEDAHRLHHTRLQVFIDHSLPVPLYFANWSFLSGNVLTSKGDGRIVIRTENLGKSLILDYRVRLNRKNYL